MIRNMLGVAVIAIAAFALTACDDGSKNTIGNPEIEKPREASTPVAPPDEGVMPSGKSDTR